MSNRSSRNNAVAGAFVLGTLALGVWASFLLADKAPAMGTRRFIVQFTLPDGATGLKKGAAVNLGGQPIGRVTRVGFARRAADGAPAPGIPAAVDVQVEISRDITLFENAPVFLERPLLGSVSAINFAGVGTPAGAGGHGGATPAIDEGDLVLGRVAPPAFLAQAGFGSDQAAQVRAAIASFEASVTRVAGLLERSGPRMEEAIADAQAVVTDLRTRLTGWSARIDATAANVEAASGRLVPLLDKADDGVESANAFLTSLRGLVDDNRARVDAIVANVDSATGKLDRETMALVNGGLTDARAALASTSDALRRIGGLVADQAPSLRRTLANLRLMSDQLKLTAVEVRSQPWRLLHQPNTKELESQVLYDATRAYAEAASDLRAASEALEAAAAPGAPGVPAPDAAALEEVSRRLAESMSAYRKAEGYLMDRLIAERAR